MQRILEPELMLEDAQSRAYAEADFEQPHSHFIKLVQSYLETTFSGYVLDLGCGAGDITLRFARAYPDCLIDAIDGSDSMLKYAHQALALEAISYQQRINFIQGIIPDVILPNQHYNLIISNSLLHHLHNPQVMWETIKNQAAIDAVVVIMDLLRPQSPEIAAQLVTQYAQNEPEILRRDFYNSLCAAFTISEIKEQLVIANLTDLEVKQVSDRHVLITGKI